MKFKKLGKKLIIPAAVCMILVGGVIPSFANNSDDTEYYFQFDKWGDTNYTDGRAKTDKSPSYMNCKQLGGGYKYSASVVANLGGGHHAEFDNTPTYTFKKGCKRKMINYVRENEYTAAAIKARMGCNPVRVDASGLWSPDYR